ncbi:MAG: sulfatase-like hydrolase/transferase [Opitutaceae bacterium]|nr:sulfatase-like hydrolase/transferase [Opitutaceae bacterium]
MRSTTRLPDDVKAFTEYLRRAGYHCSNQQKTDYNFATPREAWDESGPRAHWRKRAPGQPFFSVFNLLVTHQSMIFAPAATHEKQLARVTPAQRHDPAKVTVPPIHPDTPEFRRDWARHFDNVTAMDDQVGDLLAELAADGLAGDTIVFFFSDHGTGMPAIEMFVWDASRRVPLLVRFPEKWQHLAPAAPGATTDRLVSFVDFAPTMLALCGVERPAHFQGVPFLGSSGSTPRTVVFGGRDRMIERSDLVRYVHDGRFHYLRNFRPELPWGQSISYVQQIDSMRAWQRLHEAGALTGPPARFFETKPVEELYDVTADPWETRNLAADPRHRETLARLRDECRAQMRRAGDLGFLPERELHARAAGSTPCVIATDPTLNPLDELLRAADLANARDPKNLPPLTALLAHRDSAVRWWATLGLGALKQHAQPAAAELRRALGDDSPDVRLAAAEALAHLDHLPEALPIIEAALRHDSVFIRLAALNVADRLGPQARPLLPAIRQARLAAPGHRDASDYVARMVDSLPGRIGG